jgi:AraC-like DNA-binding protein
MVVRPEVLVAIAKGLRATYLPPAWQGEVDGSDEQMLRVTVSDMHRPVVEVAPPAARPRFEAARMEDRLVLALDPALLGRYPPFGEPREFYDPYLFGVANTIRCGFRVGIAPPADYLEAIAAEIARHLRTHYPSMQEGLSTSRLEQAIAYVGAHLSEPLTVDQLAAAAHLSVFHFSRMFRRSMGLTPHAYITQRRLELAKHLLATTELPIAHVAERAGYLTQAHFTRAFKEATTLTPLRYRREFGPSLGQVSRGQG